MLSFIQQNKIPFDTLQRVPTIYHRFSLTLQQFSAPFTCDSGQAQLLIEMSIHDNEKCKIIQGDSMCNVGKHLEPRAYEVEFTWRHRPHEWLERRRRRESVPRWICVCSTPLLCHKHSNIRRDEFPYTLGLLIGCCWETLYENVGAMESFG